jgi:hypothetical protein
LGVYLGRPQREYRSDWKEQADVIANDSFSCES